MSIPQSIFGFAEKTIYNTPKLQIQYQQPAGTVGGATTAVKKRPITNIIKNNIVGATVDLVNDEWTLPVSTYSFHAFVKSYNTRFCIAHLVDGLDFVHARSLSQRAHSANSAGMFLIMNVKLVLTVPTIFHILHYSTITGNGSNMGAPSDDGQVEIYSNIVISDLANPTIVGA